MPKQLNVNLAFTADTSKAKQNIQELQQTLAKLTSEGIKTNIGKEIDEDLRKGINSARELQTMLEKATNVNTGNLDLSRFSEEIKKSGKDIDQYAQDLSQLGPEGTKAFMQIAQAVASAEVPMKRTFAVFDQFKTALANAARWQISSSVLHGLMGAVQGAYGYAQDLNKSLTDIRIVTGQSSEQMAEFADQANKAAQALSTNTLAYTDAALIYYQQGLSDEEVAARTETTLKLSNVTGQSAEEVSSYMTAIWNNFAQGSDNLEIFADKITALGAATASSSEEIARGLQQFSALGSSLGLNYDDAVAALATVVSQTRQSADTVGNSFRTLLQRMESLKLGDTLEDGVNLTKYSEALEKVGVKVLDVNGQMRSLHDVIFDLGNAWDDLSKAEQNALAQTVGGARNSNTLIAWMDNFDKFQENIGISENAEGALQEQADTYAESWEAAQKRVSAAWQALYQDLINDDFFIEILNGLAEVLKGIDSFIDAIGGLRSVLPIIGSILTSIFAKDLMSGIETVAYNFKVFTGDAQREADEMAVKWKDAASEVAKNKFELGFEAEGRSIQDQIDFTVKLRENSEKITDENRKWLLSMNEVTKSYANAWVEAEKLKQTSEDALGDKKLEMVQRAVTSKDNTESAAKTKTDFQKAQTEFLGKENNIREQDQAIRDFIQTVSEGKIAVEDLEESFINLYKNNGDAIISYDDLGSHIEGYINILRSEKEGIITVEESEEFRKTKLNEIKELLGGVKDQEEHVTLAMMEQARQLANQHSEWGLTAQDWLELLQLQKEYTQATNDAAQAQDNYNARLKEMEQNFERAKQKVSNYADQIVKTAQGLSQLYGALSTLKSVVDEFNNDDGDDFLENLKKSLPALLTGIPMLVSSLKTLTGEGTLLGGALTSLQTTFLTTTAATGSLAAGFSAVAASIGSVLVAIAPFVLGFAAIAAVIWGVYNAIYKEEIEAKKAAKETKKLRDAWKESQQEFKTLYDEIANYDRAKNALSELKEGSIEWTAAVADLNQQVLDLIDKYPELAQYMTNENGVFGISEEGWQAQVNEKYTKSMEDQFSYINQKTMEEPKVQRDSQLNSIVGDLGTNISNDLWAWLANQWESNSEIFKGSVEDVSKALTDAGYTSEEFGLDINDLSSAIVENSDVMKSKLAEVWEVLNDTTNTQASEALRKNYLSSIVDSQFGGAIDSKAGAESDAVKNYMADQVQDKWESGELKSLEDVMRALTEEIKNFSGNTQEYENQAMNNTFSGMADQMAENRGLVTDTGQQRYADEMKGQLEDFYNSLSDEDKKIFLNLDIDKESSIEEIQESIEEVKEQAKDNIEDIRIGLDADVDEIEWENLTNFIHNNVDAINEMSNSSEKLSEDLANNKHAAAEVAEAILRFDDAIQSTEENYQTWMDMLNSGSIQDAAQAVTELKETYADLLDIRAESLSDDFAMDPENLELMKQACEGVEGAYDQLQQKMGEDIIAHLQFAPEDLSAFYNELDIIKGMLDRRNFDDLEIGAELNDAAFLGELTRMVNAAHMTAEEATSYLASMGIDAKIVEHEEDTEEEQEQVGFEPKITYEKAHYYSDYMMDNQGNVGTKTLTATFPSVTNEPILNKGVAKKQSKAFTLEVESATKKSGGNFKYEQSSHGGGSKGGGGKSGGGGGSKPSSKPSNDKPSSSGGGESSEKKKTTKEFEKFKIEEKRYYNIESAIKKVTKALSILDKLKDRAYGKAKLKYMDQEIDRLKNQLSLTEQYIEEAKKYAAYDKANLDKLNAGAQYDADGRLRNYEQVLQNLEAVYNQAILKYNQAVIQFNASDQEEEDNDALEDAKKELDKAKEAYEKNKEILDQYEKSYEKVQEQIEKRVELMNKIYDEKLSKTVWKVEVELEINEDDINQLEWLNKYLDKDIRKTTDSIANLSKQMQIYESNIALTKKGIADLFANHGMNIDVDNMNPEEMLAQLSKFMQAEGLGSELTEKEAKQLREWANNLREYADSVYEAWEKAHEKVKDALSDWESQIDRQMDKFEDLKDLLESYKDIASLSGLQSLGMTDWDIVSMDRTIYDTNKDEVESAKKAMEASQENLEKIRRAYNQAETEEAKAKWKEALEQAEDQYSSARKRYLSSFKETIESAKQIYEDALSAAKNEYNRFLNNQSERFAMRKEAQEMYLEDYEKYHELNNSSRELAKAMEKTTNPKVLSRMQDLMDGINADMAAGTKLSEVQTTIIAKRVALLQAESELLEARNAKSAVRMTRDNEGNFSYTYTADEQQMDDAEANYQDKFYDLMSYEKDSTVQLQEEWLSKQAEFYDKLEELQRKADNGEITNFEEQKAELIAIYEEYNRYYLEQLNYSFAEQNRLYMDDYTLIQSLTKTKLAEESDFARSFKDIILGQINPAIASEMDYAQMWSDAMQTADYQVTLAKQQWELDLERAYEAAGESIDGFLGKIQQETDAIERESENIKKEIGGIADEMTFQMDKIIDKIKQLDDEWCNKMAHMRDQLSGSITALNDLLEKLVHVTAQADAAADSTTAAAGAFEQVAAAKAAADKAFEIASKLYYAQGGEIPSEARNPDPGRAFDTGGYTGAWGPSGKMAVLHEKEIVLNESDTSNLLAAVDIVRGMASNLNIEGSLKKISDSIMNSITALNAIPVGNTPLDQNVMISANFPNVQSHNEIELALMNLVNSASQYVNRK